MTRLVAELASRGMSGMKLGLEPMRKACAALGNPEKLFRAVHVAGTNGKGAVTAILDAAFRARGVVGVARYTSPHLMKVNERFFINGEQVSDKDLEDASESVLASNECASLTYFETLTAAAFVLFAQKKISLAALECGLGGRLDATNVCNSVLSVITRVGLDHCDWLGNTLEEVAFEKAGIIREGVPVVLGMNDPRVREVVERRARELNAPFVYAPDIASEEEIPSAFSLSGLLNRENAVTAIASLKTLESIGVLKTAENLTDGLADVVWPGRFHRIGGVIVDGAHNPPAAEALAASLSSQLDGKKVVLVAGFCSDKDVDFVLRTLAPHVSRAVAVRTDNPRSLSAEEAASQMRGVGIEASAASSLEEALEVSGARKASSSSSSGAVEVLICGSLFLAGAALSALGAFPYPVGDAMDPSERLRAN